MSKRLDWRVPGGGIAFIAVCFILASSYFLITGGDSWYTTYVCPLFLPVGFGLWLKQEWARWVSIAFFTFVLGLMFIMFYQQGITARSGLRALVVVCMLFSLWHWDVYPEKREPEA